MASPYSLSPFAKDAGMHQDWAARVKAFAETGLEGITAHAATQLLKDMLMHPAQSRARPPTEIENIQWRAEALEQYRRVTHGASVVTAGNGSPYPVMASKARIAALVAHGANPVAIGALFRAVCRESEEECEALLSLPNPPKPSDFSAGGSSSLHRAAYNGPTPVFKIVAAHAQSADWLARDGDGRYPLGKALMSHNLARAVGCAKNAPLGQLLPDNDGNTILHQIVESFSKANSFGLGTGKWRALFDEIVAVSDAKAKNDKGETALMIAAQFGNAEAVRFLSPLSDPLAQRASDKMNALMIASEGSHWKGVDAALALVSASDPAQRNARNETALMVAARCHAQGAPRLIGALLPITDATGASVDGLTAAGIALKGEHWANLEALAEVAPQATLQTALEMVHKSTLPRCAAVVETRALRSVVAEFSPSGAAPGALRDGTQNPSSQAPRKPRAL